MNILFVTYGLPYPPSSGARIRDYNLISRVASRHRVSLLCLLENDRERQHLGTLDSLCCSVETVVGQRGRIGTAWQTVTGLLAGRPAATAPFWFPALARALMRLTSEEDFDLIQIEHSFLAPYIHAIAPGSEARTVLSMHNIGALQYRRNVAISAGMGKILAALKTWAMRGWELPLAQQFDQVITVSRHDEMLMAGQGLDCRLATIENGVDCAALQLLDEAGPEPDTLLFVGTMGYLPNRDAVRWFCRDIFPLLRARCPHIRFIAAGSGGHQYLGDLAQIEGVEIIDRVGDVIPLYLRAGLAVVPLRAGGGSRLKILEAMALGRPVVSTPIGCEGLELEYGTDIAVAGEPSAFAQAVHDLIEDRETWWRMRREARTKVEQSYDWADIATRLMVLYEELAPGEKTHHPQSQSSDISAGAVPALSVIVPVYNGAAFISDCLDALDKSSFSNFETIVVDDGSTDGSGDIARPRCDHSARFEFNCGAAAARNAGAGLASGPLLFFLDADVLVGPDTLRQVWDKMNRSGEIDGLFCSYQHDTAAKNFYSQYKNLLHHYTHQVSQRQATTFCGGFGALRRSVFETIGGFDESLDVMEDVELGYRLDQTGHRISLMPRIQLTHAKPYTFWSLTASDLFRRAIPWTRIMLNRRAFRSDLNLRANRLASVVVVYLMILAGLSLLFLPAPVVVATEAVLGMTLVMLNRRFLGFCNLMRGAWFAVRVGLISWWVYFYSGLGFVLGLLSWVGSGIDSFVRPPQGQNR